MVLGVCPAQGKVQFLKVAFLPCFGVVLILEPWQFRHQPIGLPKPLPEKADPPGELSLPAPAKQYRPRLYTCDTDEDCPMAVALFNTPDQEGLDSSLDDATTSQAPSLPALCAVLGTPPSPRAVRQALGSEPMTTKPFRRLPNPSTYAYSLSWTLNLWNRLNTFFSVTRRTTALMSAPGPSPGAGAQNCVLPQGKVFCRRSP